MIWNNIDIQFVARIERAGLGLTGPVKIISLIFFLKIHILQLFLKFL